MNSSPACQTVEKLAEGVTLKLIDDLCLVHFTGRSVDAAQTRRVGEKLIAFLERTGCRKLIMSFEGVERIYGFVLDTLTLPRRPTWAGNDSVKLCERIPAGSDSWIG